MHPFGDLSAYLDSALSSEAQATVEAHLDTCALCRTRLAELRGTARLIAGLPMPVPSRSLVPRVSVPFWLAPLRTFSTFASGAAIFLFLASAVLSSFPRATSTGAGAAPAAAPAPNTLSAPQGSPGLALDSASGAPTQFQVSSPSPAPAPNTDRAGARSLETVRSPDAKDAGRQEAPSPSAFAADGTTRSNRVIEISPFAFLSSPWLWLILGVAFAALSLMLGRRLRST
ncbi:MAG: anti-sigma factor family protein [Candidatus Limnocylindria bacterium]